MFLNADNTILELTSQSGAWSRKVSSIERPKPYQPFFSWYANGSNRVYTKRRGEQPDLNDPICLRQGATIETVCHGIHRSLASHFKSVK